MYSPCFECLNRYGRQYTEECDNTCEYAHQISKLKPYGTIDSIIEILNRGCEYAGTQEIIDELITETLKACGSKYPIGDEVSLIDADGEFSTVNEFANIFWDKAIKNIFNVIATED